jgi:hypothetical protein
LGDTDTPAAFLLVAADVLISHWPKTLGLSVPFLASPELLMVDRMRLTHDQIGRGRGTFGVVEPDEPLGAVQLKSLLQRPSRRFSLEGLLATFAIQNAPEREILKTLLARSAEELGDIKSGDNFGDARFIARYALNIIEPTNWSMVDGQSVYTRPVAEAMHLRALEQEREERANDVLVDALIYNALEDGAQITHDQIESAVAYAQRLQRMLAMLRTRFDHAW